MNRLQLATLLSWAGSNGISGRKRLQKVVFFLQQAGCKLDCTYTLHHFGPYSRDLVDACDDMVSAGLIVETGGPSQYCYSLSKGTESLIAKSPEAKMLTFRDLAIELLKEDLWLLELGSTILYFYRQVDDWGRALVEACKYKNVSVSDHKSAASLKLARKIATGESSGGQGISRPAL